MTEPAQHQITAAGVGLNVLSLGDPDLPTLVMVHGLRDVAWSLIPIAEPLTDRYHVLLPELRGHGASDKPNAYSNENFVYDLYCVIQQLASQPVVLLGHSLGGHISYRYAAVFPEQVKALVLVEGLGPPRSLERDPALSPLAYYRQRLLEMFANEPDRRPLPGYEFAAERLQKNNPRLDPHQAQIIARKAVLKGEDGQLRWAFDSRAQSVFVNVSQTQPEDFWRQVQCPTLVISGDLAHEYWGTRRPSEEHYDGAYAPGEMEARAAIFPRGEHLHFKQSGHMVHYDEPARLTMETRSFLEKHL
ncbi:MAG: alpha/beta hydrolase [Proteobacteria bacterium]|nr:alpha/beta hydrolase [Pseudomonadota bacterium]